jgi:hypothetical protein
MVRGPRRRTPMSPFAKEKTERSRGRRRREEGAGAVQAGVATPPDPHVAARPALPRRRTEEAAAARSRRSPRSRKCRRGHEAMDRAAPLLLQAVPLLFTAPSTPPSRFCIPCSAPASLPRLDTAASPSWPSHRHSRAPTQPSPCTPRTKPKHPDRDHHVSLPHCRGRPSAWTHERQAKSVHVFVRTSARRRTPRCATAELAVVAKPPSCLRAQVRTWMPPSAGQCSPPRTLLLRIQAKPRCDLACVEAFAPPLPNLAARPCPRRAALFRRRRSAHVHPHPRESSPALPVQAVHAHVHTHARPRKPAATPPRTPQSRRRGARAAPSRLPSHRRARPGASSHRRTPVHELDQAVAFALLARVR